MNDLKHYTEAELKDAAPLALSMIGDAVHTLIVRNKIFAEHPFKNNEIHPLAAKQVCAKNKALLARRIEPFLNESESFIYRKGKNAKVNSVPKNAELAEYKLATGFEALIGYLFLLGNYERIDELFELIKTTEK